MRFLVTIILLSTWLHAKKPNIIVIFSDDQGYADLGCQGVDKAPVTPNIDALAARGIRFTSGFVTAPQCEPSRTALLSGVYQQKAGVDNNLAGDMKPGIPTIASRLKEAGYLTGTVGKWGVGGEPKWAQILNKTTPSLAAADAPLQPAARGFDSYFTGVQTLYIANRDRAGKPITPTILRDEDYRVEVQNDAAVSFLDSSLGGDMPVFLYFAPYAPHVPLAAPAKYLDRFKHIPDNTRRTGLAMISCVDDGVGAIVNTLEKHKALDNTLIFFLSDNGAPRNNGSSNAPLVGMKGSLLDGGIRIPFIVSCPSILPKGVTSDAMVSSLDIIPTCLSAAGKPIPTSGLDGHDILPLLKGETQSSPHAELFFSWSGQSAVRTKTWKLIRNAADIENLHSVATPEGEKTNVISSNPEIAKDLATKLDAHLATLPKIEPTTSKPREKKNR